jgi:hypothetical protein
MHLSCLNNSNFSFNKNLSRQFDFENANLNVANLKLFSVSISEHARHILSFNFQQVRMDHDLYLMFVV